MVADGIYKAVFYTAITVVLSYSLYYMRSTISKLKEEGGDIIANAMKGITIAMSIFTSAFIISALTFILQAIYYSFERNSENDRS